MFGVGVGEGEVVEAVFGWVGRGADVAVFQFGAVAVAGAEWVDLF